MKIGLEDLKLALEVLKKKCHKTDSFGMFSLDKKRFKHYFGINDDLLLAHGDNLHFLDYLKEENRSPKLIYMDPPFYSKANYYNNIEIEGKKLKLLAYKDGRNSKETSFSQYLRYLTEIVKDSREILSEDGVIALHLDWHSVHYMKIILDEIFGYNNFVNEVIWSYKSGGSTKKYFSRKHDSILIYSKSKKYNFNTLKEKSYNRGFSKYGFKNVEEFEDELGWYTMVHMKDVWNIDMVGRSSKSRTGYATQKPRKLLDTLISAFTNEGDLVCDLFVGSGTTMESALAVKRKFVGCDINRYAILTGLNRIGFDKVKLILQVDKAEYEQGNESVKGRLHEPFAIQYNNSKEVKINKWNKPREFVELPNELEEIKGQEMFYLALALDENKRVIKCINNLKDISDYLFKEHCEIVLIDKLGYMMKLEK